MNRLILATFALAMSTPALAGKDACDMFLDGMIEGPIGASLMNGNGGDAHRTCPRTEVNIGGSGYALIDTPNFYGHVIGSANLAGSIALDTQTEVFTRVEFFRYDSVISALTSTYQGFGHTTFGITRRLMSQPYSSVAVHSRLVLPTAFGLYDTAFPYTLDLGASVRYVIAENFHFRGHLVVVGTVNGGKGPTDARFGINPTIGLDWRPGKAFALSLDFNNGFLYDDAYDHSALALGFRFSDGKRFGAELALRKPLTGRERALATAELSFHVRLGPTLESYKDGPKKIKAKRKRFRPTAIPETVVRPSEQPAPASAEEAPAEAVAPKAEAAPAAAPPAETTPEAATPAQPPAKTAPAEAPAAEAAPPAEAESATDTAPAEAPAKEAAPASPEPAEPAPATDDAK